MHVNSSTADPAARLRYPVRRDGRDAIGFYFQLFAVAMVLFVAALFLIDGMAGLRADSQRASNATMLALGGGMFTFALYSGVRLVWERLAGGYELGDDALLIDSGYARLRVPLNRLIEAYEIEVHRSYCPSKLAFRLKLAEPVRGRTTIDISPVNPDGFLDELGARCPRLVRNRRRLIPPAGTP